MYVIAANDPSVETPWFTAFFVNIVIDVTLGPILFGVYQALILRVTSDLDRGSKVYKLLIWQMDENAMLIWVI